MPTTRDVVIIGAGPAGSALATALANGGWDVLLVERDEFPRHKVCGEFLSPEAQASLRTLGLFDVVATLQPAPVAAATLVTQSGTKLTTTLPGIAWGISRYALDAALATAAVQHGAELWTSAQARNFTQVDDGFTVQIQRQNALVTVCTRAVIAAGGRHTQAGLPPRPRPLARAQRSVGIKCHYRDVQMPAQVELFFFPGGYVGVNNVEGGRVNVCLLATYNSFALAGKQVDAMLNAIATWNPAFGVRLAAGELISESVVTVAPVDPYRPAQPWDGIACVGDSAVMIPPLCGDGMAMALRSAELCAPLANEHLQGRLGLADWSLVYSQAWHAEFDGRVRLGQALQRCLARPWLADKLLKIGCVMPSLAAYLVRATRG